MVKDKGDIELDIDLSRVVSDPDYRRKVLRRLNQQRRAARYRPEWPEPAPGKGSGKQEPAPEGVKPTPCGGKRKP